MAESEVAAEPNRRRRPSKKVLVRLAIYLPLIGFFGWRAGERALAEREAADAAFRTDVGVWLETPPGLIPLTHAIPIDGDAMLSAPPEPTLAPTDPPADSPPADPTPAGPPPAEPPAVEPAAPPTPTEGLPPPP